MLNTLANHNYIPHNGRNISIDQIVAGIDKALNIEPAGVRPVAELASTTSTTGVPGTMNLNDLGRHGGKFILTILMLAWHMSLTCPK